MKDEEGEEKVEKTGKQKVEKTGKQVEYNQDTLQDSGSMDEQQPSENNVENDSDLPKTQNTETAPQVNSQPSNDSTDSL